MDPLDRLYWRLLETLRRERPGASWQMTVADIYQHLVPYRTVRGDLGFAELPEYEHALLRLLAGERGYLSLDPPRVQEELARELHAPNPILGLYRDYAEVAVLVNPAPSDDEPTRPHPDAAPLPVPDPLPATPPEVPAAVPEVLPPPQPPRPPLLCRSCRSPLPEGREVRFCPFCGVTQVSLPCRGCGESVEPEWRFCVGCGLPQQATVFPG